MGKKVKPLEKIMQKSIGFPMRQHLFFAEYPDFKPDQFCRDAIDKQILEIDPRFLKEEKDGKEET